MKLTDYTKATHSFAAFQSDLTRCLGDRIFTPAHSELVVHILRCLDYPVTADIADDPVKLAYFTDTFIADFKKQFDFWETHLTTNSNPSIWELVLFNCLDFEKVPFSVLMRFETKVKDDLAKRQDLLSFYREHRFIQEHEKTGKKPEDHHEKTLLEFFSRNLVEQNSILEYFLKHLRPRAIARSKGASSVTHFADSFFDWPYISAYPNSEKYFDHRQIDLVNHRLYHLEISTVGEIRLLYAEDEPEFYRRLKTIYPPEEVYRLIRYYIQILDPLLSERKPIFEELIELFENKKYYGFYALALSQIEGIFSEILSKINPQYKKGSLPDKVNTLRPKYEKTGMNLDYYEFHIPVLRNRFMHYGLDQEIEMKAHDLLYDLPHLLNVYSMVEIPIVKLTQVIKHRNNDDYRNEEGFTEYFDLLDKAKPHPTYKSIESQVNSYEKEFLSQLDIEFLADELSTDIPESLKELITTIKEYTKINRGSETDLDFWTEHSITTKTTQILNELEDYYEAHEEEFLKLDRYRYFLDRCPTYIPNMSKSAKTKVKDISQKYKTDLNKIKLLVDAFRKSKGEVK